MRRYALMPVLASLALTAADAPRQWPLDKGWLFHPGDHLGWAAPGLDQADWKPIEVGQAWQKQGWGRVEGYAWYRLTFDLPETIRSGDAWREGLRLVLGKVADYDQVFLNGQLLGANGTVVPAGTQPDDAFWKADESLPGLSRTYTLGMDDPRLKWGQRNVLAVRMYLVSGWGGLMAGDGPLLRRVEPADFLVLEPQRTPFTFGKRGLAKTFVVGNRSERRRLDGVLEVKGVGLVSGKTCLTRSWPIALDAKAEQKVSLQLPALPESCRLTYRFRFKGADRPVEKVEESPYILTPPVSAAPRINGAQVVGGRPGRPFVFTVPVSGQRPMQVQVKGLPAGLTLDPQTGVLSGTLPAAGEYPLAVEASNAKGRATRTLKLVVGDRLALTPPMGWNSWNAWGLAVDEEKVVASAKTFVEKGFRDHGWGYINIDDGWEIPTRSDAAKRQSDGKILVNQKFPDMARLGRRLHDLGLRFGIYSSPGPATCGGYTGSYQYELQDAQSYAAWGVDYLKYDWCSYNGVARSLTDLDELKKPFEVMGMALKAVDRDIVYSLCQYGMGNVWTWGGQVGGQLWRTTGDITDTWQSVKEIGFSQVENAPYAGPGGWNDPDMLVVGWVGWGAHLHPSRLTPDEQYTHLSLWSLLSAPLLIGCDLTRLDPFTTSLLTNDEVLAIDQDPLGRAATPKVKRGEVQVWVKELADGGKALGIFNLGATTTTFHLDPKEVGLPGKAKLRDLWRQAPLKGLDLKIPPHGVVLVKATS